MYSTSSSALDDVAICVPCALRAARITTWRSETRSKHIYVCGVQTRTLPYLTRDYCNIISRTEGGSVSSSSRLRKRARTKKRHAAQKPTTMLKSGDKSLRFGRFNYIQ